MRAVVWRIACAAMALSLALVPTSGVVSKLPNPDAAQDSDQEEGIRIRLNWSPNGTDLDLHVFDPDGAHASWEELDGIPGGQLNQDDLQGEQTEVFTMVEPRPGVYLIRVNYYSNDEEDGEEDGEEDVQATHAPDSIPVTAQLTVAVNGKERFSRSYTLTQTDQNATNGSPGNPASVWDAYELIIYDEVEVMVRAFIPCDAAQSPTDVALPYVGEVFGGDRQPSTGGGFGAAFSYSHAAVRFQEGVLVTPDPDLEPLIEVTKNRNWTSTRVFVRDGTARVRGGPWWCWTVIDAQPFEVVPATIGGGDAMAQVQSSNGVVKVTYAMHAGNAYPPLGIVRIPNPIVDADIVVEIRQDRDNPPEYRIKGSHDGFPAWELYLNKKRVYECDPLATGASPRALYPPQDQKVDLDWQELPPGEQEVTPKRCSSVTAISTTEHEVAAGSTVALIGSGLQPSIDAASAFLTDDVALLMNRVEVAQVSVDANGFLETVLDTTSLQNGQHLIEVEIGGQVVAATTLVINESAPKFAMDFEGIDPILLPDIPVAPTVQLWLPNLQN